jgi:hypothetical protein
MDKSYVIIQELSTDKLQNKVIEYLSSGYSCLGGAVMLKNRDGFSYISQTMILTSLLP